MTDEELYMMECKHYGYEGNCYKKSLSTGIFRIATHITMGCDGDCARMKRYRKLKGEEK